MRNIYPSETKSGHRAMLFFIDNVGLQPEKYGEQQKTTGRECRNETGIIPRSNMCNHGSDWILKTKSRPTNFQLLHSQFRSQAPDLWSFLAGGDINLGVTDTLTTSMTCALHWESSCRPCRAKSNNFLYSESVFWDSCRPEPVTTWKKQDEIN